MSALYAVALVAALAVFVYLVVALFFPEKFS
jgi:F subunit of K+-transporting ATPase (Potass_KdpF).